MKDSTKRLAIGATVALMAVRAAAQDGIALDDLLDRVGEKIEQYFARVLDE